MTRLSDIVLSFVSIILLIPLFIPLVLLLRFTGEGKVFYKQKRIGRNKTKFNLLKFATMLEDSPNMPGGDITTGNDPRVLPVCYFLRKTKINELPQLIYILCGDISIIGPRPLTPKNFQMYNEGVQEIISKVRPGLSGIGSVIFRDEEKVISSSDKSSFDCYKDDISPYKGGLECWFVENQSINLYVSLMLITIWVILFPNSKIVWRLFPKLPIPPKSLASLLNYC